MKRSVPEVTNLASGVHRAGINDTSHNVSKGQEAINKRTKRQSISFYAPIHIASRFVTVLLKDYART